MWFYCVWFYEISRKGTKIIDFGQKRHRFFAFVRADGTFREDFPAVLKQLWK